MPSCCRNSSTISPVLLDQEGEDVTELNVCWTRRCRTFGTWSVGSRRSSTTSTTLLNASAYGLRGYVDTLSPLVAMHLHGYILCVHRIFFVFHATFFPNSGFRARSMRRWYERVERKELWAVIVILLTTNVLFWFCGIVGWSGPDQPYMSTYMRSVPPTDMQLVLHKGGWRVSISPTLVDSNLTMAGPWRRLK